MSKLLTVITKKRTIIVIEINRQPKDFGYKWAPMVSAGWLSAGHLERLYQFKKSTQWEKVPEKIHMSIV